MTITEIVAATGVSKTNVCSRKKHLHVAVDGNCTFCTDYPCFPPGNVKEQSLMEIFTGDAANRFRSAPEKWCCRHCSWKNRENTIIHFPID